MRKKAEITAKKMFWQSLNFQNLNTTYMSSFLLGTWHKRMRLPHTTRHNRTIKLPGNTMNRIPKLGRTVVLNLNQGTVEPSDLSRTHEHSIINNTIMRIKASLAFDTPFLPARTHKEAGLPELTKGRVCPNSQRGGSARTHKEAGCFLWLWTKSKRIV